MPNSKQRNVELEAKNAELEVWRQRVTLHEEKIAELKAKSGDLATENFDLKGEIMKLKTSVEEQERKNTELESRFAIMEQGSSVVDGQPQNDKEATLETLPEVSADNDSVVDQLKQHAPVCKVNEPRGVSHNSSNNSTSNFNSVVDQSAVYYSKHSGVPLVHKENPNSETVVASLDSAKQKVEQDLRRELSAYMESKESVLQSGNRAFDIQIPEVSLETILTGSCEVTAQNIVDLFRTAIKVRRKEILCWYCFYKAYEDRVGVIKTVDNIKDQSARTLVYNEIKALLPDITDVNLRQKKYRAKRIYMLFTGIGIDKIQAVTCSASAISGLSDNQIQGIINDFKKADEMIGVTNCNAHVTESSEVSVPTAPQSVKETNEEMPNDSPKAVLTPISQTSRTNPTYDHSYFRNKILDQYPNLYRECTCENFDYYGITDETSCGDYICPLCKLGHDDEEIEGEYKAGSYFIKCEQREIEIVA